MQVRKSLLFGLASLVCWAGAAGVGYHAVGNLRAGAAGGPPKTAVVVHGPATPSAAPTATPIPASLSIQGVPFTIQAPFQNWDQAHEEYCEAAAVYMVGQYWSNDHRQQLPPAEADTAMARMVAWERSTYPGVLNLPLSDMAQVGQHFYASDNLTAQVVPLDFTVIQRSLAAGRPVIIPVMTHGGPGGSPIYPTYGAGDVYHVLVLIGYDTTKGVVYTNDAGLREGMGLAYPWATLQSAVNAQAHATTDAAGASVPAQQGATMLILHPGP